MAEEHPTPDSEEVNATPESQQQELDLGPAQPVEPEPEPTPSPAPSKLFVDKFRENGFNIDEGATDADIAGHVVDAVAGYNQLQEQYNALQQQLEERNAQLAQAAAAQHSYLLSEAVVSPSVPGRRRKAQPMRCRSKGPHTQPAFQARRLCMERWSGRPSQQTPGRAGSRERA